MPGTAAAVSSIDGARNDEALVRVAPLPEVEPGLLALFFSACEAQTLLRVEVALGAQLGREVRASITHRWNWMRVLSEECGLSLAAVASDGSGDPPSPRALAAAAQKARVSVPIAGGWQGIRKGDLATFASVLSKLQVALPSGREIRNPETGHCWGRADRVGEQVHFDVHGCFEGTAWQAIEKSFRTNTALPAGAPRGTSSSAATWSVAGQLLELALVLSSFPNNLGGSQQGPEGGAYFGLEIRGLAALFESGALGLEDVVHVACVVRCGSIERKCGHVLKYSREAGHVVDIGLKHLWPLVPLPNMGMALRIDVEEIGSEEGLQRFSIDEDVTNAHWNGQLTGGTELVPLVWLEDNEFALQQPPPGSLDGCAVLVRRGGGCGFAQKALAAQAAGAAACVVYEAPGDREMLGEVHAMGTLYQGVDYPAPEIPTVLVGAADGERLLAAARAPGGARARLNLGRSVEALRRPAQSFKAFQRLAASGEPVHVALLLERIRDPHWEFGIWGPQVSWFQEPDMRRPDPKNEAWVAVAELAVFLAGELP